MGYWNSVENCTKEMEKYSSRTELKDKNIACFKGAKKLGLLDTIFPLKDKEDGYWNIFEHCQEKAILCKCVSELRKKYNYVYQASLRNNWLDKLKYSLENGQEVINEERRLKRQEDFINKAKLAHKNENIDYSKVHYINNRANVLLIGHDLRLDGTEYVEFWQEPNSHLRGHGKQLLNENLLKNIKK